MLEAFNKSGNMNENPRVKINKLEMEIKDLKEGNEINERNAFQYEKLSKNNESEKIIAKSETDKLKFECFVYIFS